MASPTPKPAGKYCHLTTTYTSPSSQPFTHTSKIPAPGGSSNPKDRVAYLASLKTATTEVQKVINDELTARMEEDKAREAATSSAAGTKRKAGADVDEDKEEDNYGEEVAEED